jgi:hypothetical protein
MSPKAVSIAASTAVLTTLAVFFATPARALTLNSTNASWNNVVDGTNVNFQNDDGESQVRWGEDLGYGQSGLGFTGISSMSINPNTVFNLGRLRHFNYTIASGTAASTVDLALDLNFDSIGTQTFDFTFDIDETTNETPCEYPSTPGNPCADTISWEDAFSSQSFTYQSSEFNLQLMGFRSSPNDPMISQFITQEGDISDTNLFAKVNQMSDSKSVPEPTTGIGLALLGTYLVTSFRKRKTNEDKT